MLAFLIVIINQDIDEFVLTYDGINITTKALASIIMGTTIIGEE